MILDGKHGTVYVSELDDWDTAQTMHSSDGWVRYSCCDSWWWAPPNSPTRCLFCGALHQRELSPWTTTN